MADAAPGSHGRVLAALVAGQLGMHSAMAGLRMAAPLQALHEHYSAWSVGLLLALFAAAPVATALWAGRLADRLGYHRPVYLAVAITAGGGLVALLSTLFTGPLQFALLCLAALLMLMPLASLLTARLVPRLQPLGVAAVVAGRRAWDLLREPGFKRLLVVNWLLSMCWDVHTFAVPVLGHERGFSASTIGLILGTFTLSVTGVRLIIPLLAHRLSEATVLRVAMLGTGLIFAAYPLAPNALVMGGCAVLLGLTLGSVQPMVMSMLHHLTPHNRHGEALAFRSMAINASSTLMPLAFGAAGTLAGAGLLFWVVGGAVGAGSWLARRFAPAA